MARQATGVTPMDVTGEVDCSLARGQWTFELDALVVRQLDVDILPGNPFMVRNDIGVRPAKRQVEIGGTEIIRYSSPSRHTRQLNPRLDCLSNMPRKAVEAWPPPKQIQSVDHAVRVSNTTGSPTLLKSGEQLCQLRQILPVESSTSPPPTCGAVSPSPATCNPFSPRVIFDPDGCLDSDTRDKSIALNLEFYDVFNPSISKYNGASGTIEAVVNIGPTLPPQCKGMLPQYNRNTLEELQNKFDELEAAGVLAKPKQVNVHEKYLNTSFLVKRPNGGSRLVTSFGEVAQYISRYSVHIRHIAGVRNLPSDYASRNPKECSDSSCQICKFNIDFEDSVVHSLYVSDVLQGSVKMPFTSRAAWQATQLECPHLQRTHSHLSQGTRPSKKATKIIDVKRYLKDVTIAADGLLAVRDYQPFQPPLERLVVPRSVLKSLLIALYIRFNNPSKYHTKRLFTRYFFALDVDKAIDLIWSSCHICESLKSIPKHFQPQSSEEPTQSISVSFAADLARRHRKLIPVLRETVSSYTLTTLIKSEKHEDLRNALMILCSQLHSLHDGGATIRVDPALGFCALTTDPFLLSNGITLEIGRVKNRNKNPVAERCTEALGLELLNLSSDGGPVSDVTLALATANMNSRIVRDCLSAQEAWTQRDQQTGEQPPIVDRKLILSQHYPRQQNHRSSAKSKARGRTNLPSAAVSVGDLVFLKVAPTVLAQSPHGSIRGLHKPLPFDTDDDTDPVVLPRRHSTVHAPSIVVTQPPAYEKPTVPQPVYDIVPVQDTVPAQKIPPVPAAIVPSTCSPASSLLQTARRFQTLLLSLLLSFIPGGLVANETPNFGKIRTGT
ncbi:hypothetical protein AWC38_SpisGene10642 [Stylophora pistillata]|uniref:Uncharacterized protein n=1 Tax=Stylophora pistillata TaxID=50429 RepID=A0A2B4S4B2_STYPI|nr:hypothetical protein AWC38_SpisGene10642 [Stylophora pistillata]